MWRSVILNKSTETNAPSQVLSSLNEANSSELWKKSRFVCCQLVKCYFAARALFFCFIPFLFLEIQITGVKNSRLKNGSVYKPLGYKPTKNACDSV